MITSSQEWDNDEDGNAPSFAIDRWREFVNNRCAGGKKSVFLQTRPGKLRPAPDVGTPAAVGPRAERRPHTSGGGLGTPGREGWVCCTPGLIRFSAGTTPVPNRDGGAARSASPNDAHGGCHMSTDDDDSSSSFSLGSLCRRFCHRDGGILHPPPNLSGNLPP